MSEEFKGSAADVAVEPTDVDGGGGDLGFTPADGGPEGSAGAAPDGAVTDPGPAGATDPDQATDPAEATEPADALAAEAARAQEFLLLAQRTKADFDNFRKRAARDAALAAERGALKLARELLPALDNLERAITHAAEDDPLLGGIRLVQTDLLAALSRAGIESFSPTGEAFDPQVHEAVAQAPVEGAAPGTVVEVYQPGYRTAEQVLRPARVLVAA